MMLKVSKLVRFGKVLVLLLLLQFSVCRFMGLASSAITVFVQPGTKVVVVGAVFTVDICIENVPANGLFSYQLTLSYNNTVLEGMNVTLPEGHFLEPEEPDLIFVVQCHVNQTRGKVYLAVTLLGAPPVKMGNGTLATVTFRANLTGNSILDILDIPWDKLILSPQAAPRTKTLTYLADLRKSCPRT